MVASSLQLIAGRTGQEFNQRKQRKGAFWEDRYHATAVDKDEHLIRCLIYIDLNMVRAGVVTHPGEWELNGYNEIQNPPERYSVIDRQSVMQACGFTDYQQFKEQHKKWVEQAIAEGSSRRESCWTESIAVGSGTFVADVKFKLGIDAKGRRVQEQSDGVSVLREEVVSYDAEFGSEMGTLSAGNAYYWEDFEIVLAD